MAAATATATSVRSSADVVDTRLVTRDSLASTEPSVGRVASQLASLVDALRNRDDGEAWTEEFQALERELHMYDLSMRRADMVKRRCEAELKAYGKVHADIDAEIQATRSKIAELAQQLARERRVRANREQYEALAHTINKHVDRATAAAELAKLDAELVALKAKSDATDGKLELRTKQFQVLLHSVWDLQQQLEEEAVDADAAADGDDGADEDDEDDDIVGAQSGRGRGGDDDDEDDDDDDDDDVDMSGKSRRRSSNKGSGATKQPDSQQGGEEEEEGEEGEEGAAPVTTAPAAAPTASPTPTPEPARSPTENDDVDMTS